MNGLLFTVETRILSRVEQLVFWLRICLSSTCVLRTGVKSDAKL